MWPQRFWLKLQSLFRRSRNARQLDDEIQFHLDQQIAENVAAGMSRDEARYAATRTFGNSTYLKEQTRDTWGWVWVEQCAQDLRYGARALHKNPGYTIVTVLTLALGIGANTAIFSVIEAVLLRPLPYKDPSRLVVVADREAPAHGGFLFKDFEACKSHLRSFENMAAYYRDTGISRVTLTAGGEPESVHGAFVSSEFFPTLGVPPQLGRFFNSDEEVHRVHVVVLSHGLWLRRYGASADVLGEKLQIDGSDWEIIGVMPAGFAFPNKDQQLWAPLTTNRSWQEAALTTNIDPSNTRLFYARWLVVGRLKTAASVAQAQAEVDSLFARLAQSDPDKNRAPVEVLPLGVHLSGNTRLALYVLSMAVFLVLLISCSNVANLVLARGAGREREMAVRAALGAGRVRLTCQLFTESLLLALVSGGLGLALAFAGVRALIAFAPGDIPRLNEARLDAGVLAFTVGMSLLSAILFGLLPAWKASQQDPQESLKSAGRNPGAPISLKRTRDVLVVAEFALAIVLLTGAGLLVRSFLAVQAVDLGFRPEHVLTMRINMPAGVPQPRVLALHHEVLQRIAALPDVKAVGAISDLFELGDVGNLGLRAIEGRDPEPPDKWTPLVWQSVSGVYFQAMGASLLRGRSFSDQDGPDSPLVAVIDENMARRYWPNEDPVGKRFKGQDPRGHNDDWITVIGVVRNMRRNGLERQSVPHIFQWYKQDTSAGIRGLAPPDLVVRTTGDSRAVGASLRAVVRSLDRTAILSSVTTMKEQLSEQLSSRRFQTSLLGLFSLMALLLAVVGMFALLHYSVAQRTHEMGVRIALGAQRKQLLRQVIYEGVRLAIAGVLIGILGAVAMTRLISSLLFGVRATDPTTFAGVAALLILTALLACYIPARRAMRVDPMVALRYE
jgi:putative ABC transport system permease protein